MLDADVAASLAEAVVEDAVVVVIPEERDEPTKSLCQHLYSSEQAENNWTRKLSVKKMPAKPRQMDQNACPVAC